MNLSSVLRSLIGLSKVVLLFATCSVLTNQYSSAQTEPSNQTEKTSKIEPESLLKTKLSRERLQEQLEAAKIVETRKLPGGVFVAPQLHKTFKRIVESFKKTKLLDPDVHIEIFLASTPVVNAWVSNVQSVKEIKAFHVVFTKGIIDLVSGGETAIKMVGPEFADFLAARAETVLAAVMAHELGHVMHGDTENPKVTTRVYGELAADLFAVELSSAAGYNPRGKVWILEAFEKLHKNKSIARLVSQMLDEHPKPSFRIANIMELVDTLESSKEARKELGFSDLNVDSIPDRPLRRDAQLEKTSRTGVEAFKKSIGSPQYVSATHNEKGLFLERYLSKVQGASNDWGLQLTLVAICQQYAVLAEAQPDLTSLDAVIESFRRFGSNFANGLKGSADRKEESPKLAVRLAHSAMQSRQFDLLAKQYPQGLTIETFEAYSRYIDSKVLYGRLFQEIGQATTIERLKELLAVHLDHDFHFQRRFLKGGVNSEDSSAKDLGLEVYSKVAVRVLHLEKDLARALDFMQAHFPLRNVNGSTSGAIPATDKTFAAMVYYISQHDDVRVEEFNERMDQSKTAIDRTYSIMFNYFSNNTFEKYAQLRRRVADGDPSHHGFTYGMGRRFRSKLQPEPELVKTLARFLGAGNVQHVFSDFSVGRVTFHEAILILAASSPFQKDFWRQLAKDFPETGSAPRREIEAQIYEVEKLILSRFPDSLNQPVVGNEVEIAKGSLAEDLRRVHLGAPAIRAKKIIETTQAFGTADFIKVPTPRENSETTQEKEIQLRPRTGVELKSLDNDGRVELYEKTILLATSSLITKHLTNVRRSIPGIEAALTELMQEGQITVQLRSDFLKALNEFLETAQKFDHNQSIESQKTYFDQRRDMYSQTYVLLKNLGLEKKITTESSTALNGIVGMTRESISNNPAALFSNLVPTEREAIEYLQNPETAKSVSLELGRRLNSIALLAQGLGDLKDSNFSTEEPIFSTKAQLARLLYLKKLAASSRGLVATNRAMQMKLKSTNRLLALPESFVDALVNYAQKSGIVNAMEPVYQMTLESAWPLQVRAAFDSSDAVDALVGSVGLIDQARLRMNEEQSRIAYILLARSLSRVDSKEKMELYTSVLGLMLDGGSGLGFQPGMELLSAKPEDLAKITAMKYREHYFDKLAGLITKYGAWKGQGLTAPVGIHLAMNSVMRFLSRQASSLFVARDHRLYRIWLLKDTIVPWILNSVWFKRFAAKAMVAVGDFVVAGALRRGNEAGPVDPFVLIHNLRKNSPWAPMFDEAIQELVVSGKFKSWMSQFSFTNKEREFAVRLTKEIRSLTLRDETYRHVISVYGNVKTGPIKSLKNWWALYQAYKSAEIIWTKEVLEELRQTDSLVAMLKVTELAWEEHVKERAGELGVTKDDSYLRLLELKQARETVEAPVAGEVSEVFPEASRHRDDYLESYLKTRPTDLEQLKIFEEFKARSSESPYHKLSKAMFEFLDEYISKLNSAEKVEVMFYLSDLDKEMRPALKEKMRRMFEGTENRRKMQKSKGFYFEIADVKKAFGETHPEERLIAYRAIFVSGVDKDNAANKTIVDRLLLSDTDMPPYLRRLLTHYLDILNSHEKSDMLSWLLANGSRGPLKGPEIVKLMIGKGGIVAAKIAQLVASHGFRLSREYQDVLEKYKGDAQKVDKLQALKWISERLPKDKFEQIKTLDRELGSGSFKIGYLATLKDGRRVVIMLSRQYAIERTAREFQVMRELLQRIMADPQLKIENLPGLQREVERIIKEEMSFKNEAEMMRKHKELYFERPWLVRQFGQDVRVLVPQPLEGWIGEGIIVEEFIESSKFSQLPKTAMSGWSQERLAKAALDEVLHQLISYWDVNPDSPRKVLLDIDPHEENQLGKRNALGLRSAMVNIDLGQSIFVEPDRLRELHEIIFRIFRKDYVNAIKGLETFVEFRNVADRIAFESELKTQASNQSDPVEILTKAIEEKELEGITLKPEFLFLQKLFATIVGLKKHISDPNYITKQMVKIMALRMVADPARAVPEVRRIVEGPKNAQGQPQNQGGRLEKMCGAILGKTGGQ
jgi:predicted unusual protein kinase regulating ubiquinone biosynthesis (AarF/ABC1/UbiB family)